MKGAIIFNKVTVTIEKEELTDLEIQEVVINCARKECESTLLTYSKDNQVIVLSPIEAWMSKTPKEKSESESILYDAPKITIDFQMEKSVDVWIRALKEVKVYLKKRNSEVETTSNEE